MDVDALEPGVDFVERIETSVASVDALVAVIGRDWLTARDEDGRRRLDDPTDFVRIEIASALSRKIRVIPVLVEGARMPDADELPDDLTALARRNALTISDLDWKSGARRLVETLQRLLAADQAAIAEGPQPPVVPDAASAARPAGGALELLGAALLTLGPFIPWNHGRSFVRPSFGPVAGAEHAGVLTGLAPVGVAVGALVGILLARRAATRALGVGLALGFGAVGVVKYVGVLWLTSSQADTDVVAVGGALLAIAGAAAIVAVQVGRVRRLGETSAAPGLPRVSLLAAGGAALGFVGTVIPFNGGGPSFPNDQVLIQRPGGEAFEPLATAVVLAVLAVVAWRGRSRVVGALLVGIGIASSLLWLRYIGVPILERDDVASPGAGGFVGLGGALLAVAAGYLELQAEEEESVSVSLLPAP